MKSTRTWILIADGRTAQIVENTGPGHGIATVEGQQFSAPPKKEYSDSEGRAFDSVGGQRHKQAPHFSKEDEFARSLVAALEKSRRQDLFDRLILCASPEMLGLLRPLLSEQLQSALHAEIAKNLTKIPLLELPRYFEDSLAV